MKVNEIISTPLEEGWKEKLAALGVAGSLGLGGAAYDYSKNPEQGPEIIKQLVGKQEPKQKSPDNFSVGKIHQDKIQDLAKAAQPALKKSKIDITKLSQVLPGPGQLLKKYAIQAGIAGEELVQFLAQAAHETQNFSRLEEVGSQRYFRQYDPKFNPRKAKILGNTKAGDGEKYKGRGFLQITGRWNYRAAGKALGLPLEQNPELVNKPEVAAKVSIWYWNTFVKPEVDSFNNVKDVTKEINPGLYGLEDRKEKFQYLMKVAAR